MSWEGERPFRVAGAKLECAGVRSLVLAPADGGGVPEFQPGQVTGPPDERLYFLFGLDATGRTRILRRESRE